MSSMIENEILKHTKYKRTDDQDDQDYLAALVREVNKLPDGIFDRLSDEAAEWYDQAATALEERDDIPMWPDEVESEVDDETVDDESADAEGDEDEPEGDVPRQAAGPLSADDDADGDEAIDTSDIPEATEEDFKQMKLKLHDEKVKPKKAAPVGIEKVKLKKPKKPVVLFETPMAQPKPAKAKIKDPADAHEGKRDKWGVFIGTKTHEALEMYERGTTAQELERVLGGRHYNILKKLMKDGHRVEKGTMGLWKITHKDEVAKEQAKGKAPKKGK